MGISISPKGQVCSTTATSKRRSIQYACQSRWKDWWKDEFTHWELEAFDFLVKEDQCLVSFGEWIGPHIIPYALEQTSSKIIVFEPDPLAYSDLVVGLALNQLDQRIRPHLACVNMNGEMVNLRGVGMSGSSIKKVKGSEHWLMWVSMCFPIYDLLESYAKECTFKVDIEGYEETLIEALIAVPPKRLSLSVHRYYLENSTIFEQKLQSLVKKYELCKFSSNSEELFCV
jgi:hypothetical protein